MTSSSGSSSTRVSDEPVGSGGSDGSSGRSGITTGSVVDSSNILSELGVTSCGGSSSSSDSGTTGSSSSGCGNSSGSSTGVSAEPVGMGSSGGSNESDESSGSSGTTSGSGSGSDSDTSTVSSSQKQNRKLRTRKRKSGHTSQNLREKKPRLAAALAEPGDMLAPNLTPETMSDDLAEDLLYDYGITFINSSAEAAMDLPVFKALEGRVGLVLTDPPYGTIVCCALQCGLT